MSSSISSDYGSVVPLLVTGYESNRNTRNIFHQVLGGGEDVTLQPASLRRGRLSCLFASEQDAVDCELMHAGTYVLSFADSDLPLASMRYVPDGSIVRRLDQETYLWTVDIDYQEVEL
ncbi:hypothetical protein [Frigoribacterium sp. VKM Ac-2836]|uniref:hypothetical protein n=1 Tax=Frigoribacterium sp. VKM Ac-2836 TaxID=2739014 RepID=UPI0015670163|nr:hypothetical protein [Frigoribacterium sp. VKM Ac-2836]NRD25847.1 hypothetical protein [Frigoribacterium sp. VKM Ac-2836]